MTDTPASQRYLRFARALALVSLGAAAGGCRQVGAIVGCEHCHCGPPASVHRPVACETVSRLDCCFVEGPLPPPDLAA
jgi:hypothetical protein